MSNLAATSPIPQPTAVEIQTQVARLFPRESLACSRPCVLARLFAAFSLVVANESPPNNSSNNNNSNIQHLTTLCAALVHVEATALGDTPTFFPPSSKKRKVHFNASDCSATLPPVDREGGETDWHQQQTIKAMKQAMDQVNLFVQQQRTLDINNTENTSKTTSHSFPHGLHTLQDLIQFLDGPLQSRQQLQGQYSLLAACAAAVEPGYPPDRVAILAADTRDELRAIQQRIHLDDSPTAAASPPLLRLEQRFAEFVGQNIRWGLRKLHNGALPMITTQNETYEKRMDQFSQVDTKVILSASGKAVDDGCISAIVSRALYRLVDCFGLDFFLPNHQPSVTASTTNTTTANQKRAFFTHPVSSLHFKARGEPNPLSPQQLQDLITDIQQAFSFLAASASCNFLCKLWTEPGVQQEIQRLGGWSQIEQSAQYSLDYELYKLCPLDGHLVPLCNQAHLVQRLQSHQAAWTSQARSCQARLTQVIKRFCVDTKSQNLLQKYKEQIAQLSECVQEGRESLAVLPKIRRRPQKKKVTPF